MEPGTCLSIRMLSPSSGGLDFLSGLTDISTLQQKTIMNTNQIFNWKRFTATLRKEVAESWRTPVLILVGIYLWYTTAMIISHLHSSSGSYNINPLLFSLIAAIMAGLAFHNLKTRYGRVHYLTCPSSTVEKYVVNLLLYFIGPFVIFAIGFQLADFTRYLFMGLFNTDPSIANTSPINLVNLFKNHHSDLQDIFIFVETLGIGAAFFLSSVLWPRRSMRNMAVVVLGLAIIKIAIAAYTSYLFLGGREYMVPTNIRSSFFDQLATAGIWFDAIFYTLCLVMTWYVLKHKDVITLKWWK